MSHDVEQKLLDLLENCLEVSGEFVAVLGREHSLVIDHLLDVGHDVVHVLGCRQASLLPLLVYP